VTWNVLGNQGGNVLLNKEVGVELRGIDLLRRVYPHHSVNGDNRRNWARTGTEWQHTSPEVSRVERNVDARQGNSCDTTFQSNVTTLRSLLLLCDLKGVVDDIFLLKTEGLQKLTDVWFISVIPHGGTPSYLLGVNILLLEVIKNVCEGLQSQKIACRDILRTLKTQSQLM
jgi:hypothetical protein